MARIPDSVVDEVSARTSILDVVGQTVRLKRKGGRHWGLCPFHDEKTPSFSVNAERNLYYCFGCQASGSPIKFVMEQQGLSFPEAVRQLADRLGIVIPEQGEDDGRARQRKKAREQYMEATGFARDLYERALWSRKFAEPLAYLEERGVDEETAKAFGLGYAPEAWSTLLDRAAREGIDGRALEKAGLVLPRREGNGHYDRFRHRVMFPVLSLSGQVLAFSGRALSAEERAKYINSPETAFYTKGRELYGLHVAHKGIRKAGQAVLVEGNFDVVSLHAKGFDMTCAALGTALTEVQAKLLKRYTDRVLLMFDADSAGREAARKALQVLLACDVTDVALVELPDGTDPDDYVRSAGAGALQERIDAARPMLDLLLDEAIRPAAGMADPSTKRRAVDEVGELLAPVRSELLLRGHVEQAARRLELNARDIEQAVARAIRGERRYEPEPDRAAPIEVRAEVRALDELEATLVATMIEDDALLMDFYREQAHHVIEHAALRDWLERVAAAYANEGAGGLRQAIERDPEDPLARAITRAAVVDRALQPDTVRAAFEETLTRLKCRWIRAELVRLGEQLRAANQSGDFELELELLERQTELHRWLTELDPQMRSISPPAAE